MDVIIDLCDDDTPPAVDVVLQGTDLCNDGAIILIDDSDEDSDKPSYKQRRKKGSNEATPIVLVDDQLPNTAPAVFGFAEAVQKKAKESNENDSKEKEEGNETDLVSDDQEEADMSIGKVNADESSKVMDLDDIGEKEATPLGADHCSNHLKDYKEALPVDLNSSKENDKNSKEKVEGVYPAIMTSVEYSHEKVSAVTASGSSSRIGGSGYIGPSNGNMPNSTSAFTSPSLNNTSLNLNTSMYLSNDDNDGLDDPSLDDESRDLIRQLSEQNKADLAVLEEQERLTLSLIHEEQSERQKELDNRRYKCCLCLDDDVKLEDMITLGCQPEAHRFCLECFSSYCTDKIKDAIVTPDKLICPMPDCNYSISYIELKNNIPETVFEKYESFTMRHFGETSDDCRFCPKCNEWFAEVPQTDEDEHIWKTVQCEKEECQHTFCGRCGQQPHKSQYDQDLTCEQYAAWQTANSKVDEDLEKYMKDNKITRCPKCNQGGELKNGNCKFVYCRCGARFCYLCGVQLEERQHYSHFQAGTTGRGDYLTGKKLTGPFGNGCLGPNDPQLSKGSGKGKGKEQAEGNAPMPIIPAAPRRGKAWNAPYERKKRARGGRRGAEPHVIPMAVPVAPVPAMPAGVQVVDVPPGRRKRNRKK